ncbi:MAG TPA: alpha/beta fold hydrolase [Blastocatellia bacterium]|nr:alpha/beta fold hydrolase [Blastocatellia bacterium]
MYPAGNLFIPATHGRLESIYRPKSNHAERVTLVLHPHPLHGGTMHNKVVFRAAKALNECGFETLRFNFRGVGLSTGEFDEGRGECADAQVALDYLLDSQPNAREVIVAGFSFGSIVGLRVGCSDERVDRLIAIGAPARLLLPLQMDNPDFLAGCAKPKLFIHGTEDDLAPLAPLEEFLAMLPADSDFKIERIAGAGHFFDNHAGELMRAIKNFVDGATTVNER